MQGKLNVITPGGWFERERKKYVILNKYRDGREFFMNLFVGGFCLLCFTLVKRWVFPSISCCESVIKTYNFRFIFMMNSQIVQLPLFYQGGRKLCIGYHRGLVDFLSTVGTHSLRECRNKYKWLVKSPHSGLKTSVHAWPISKNDSWELFALMPALIRKWRKLMMTQKNIRGKNIP